MILAEPMMNFFSPQHVAANSQTIAIITSWVLWEGLLKELVWIAAVPLLAGYAWRRRESLAASGSPIFSELRRGEDEVARGLQGQGLSLDEAKLVLAQRRGSQGVPSLAPATGRGLWLERVVWMVTGVALNRFLDYLMVNPAWVVAAATRPAAPLYQHLGGVASVSLGLALATAVIAGLWRWIKRHPRQSGFIGCICLRRPVLAASALVGMCAGFGLGEYALFTHVVRPANLSFGAIGSQWMTYGGTLTQVLIPIALLLWLARRWRGLQTRPASGG